MYVCRVIDLNTLVINKNLKHGYEVNFSTNWHNSNYIVINNHVENPTE